jgi:tripartite-type tricarboxylate transporter receptor subunit TctC
MKKGLKIIKVAFIIVLVLGFTSLAVAKDYPKRPIKLIVPWGAGGSSSMSGRIVAQAFAQILEEAMIIVNKPGAGGTIGAAYAKKAKPDGYTLFHFNSGSNGVSTLRSNIGYTNNDFQLIGQYAIGQAALAVRADSPWKTVKDLVEYAKDNPGKLKYPAGVGGTARFAAELFKAEAGGLDIPRVPARSGAEVNQLLMSGNVQLTCSPATDLRGLVDAGKVRFLAYCNQERNKDYPDVPTFIEAGYPGIVISTWYGLAAPKGLPSDISKILEDTLASVMKEKVVNRMLNNIGHTPTYRNPQDFRSFVDGMGKLYQRIAKEAGIKLD